MTATSADYRTERQNRPSTLQLKFLAMTLVPGITVE
jgi:hypothetical protein